MLVNSVDSANKLCFFFCPAQFQLVNLKVPRQINIFLMLTQLLNILNIIKNNNLSLNTSTESSPAILFADCPRNRIIVYTCKLFYM